MLPLLSVCLLLPLLYIDTQARGKYSCGVLPRGSALTDSYHSQRNNQFMHTTSLSVISFNKLLSSPHACTRIPILHLTHKTHYSLDAPSLTQKLNSIDTRLQVKGFSKRLVPTSSLIPAGSNVRAIGIRCRRRWTWRRLV